MGCGGSGGAVDSVKKNVGNLVKSMKDCGVVSLDGFFKTFKGATAKYVGKFYYNLYFYF